MRAWCDEELASLRRARCQRTAIDGERAGGCTRDVKLSEPRSKGCQHVIREGDGGRIGRVETKRVAGEIGGAGIVSCGLVHADRTSHGGGTWRGAMREIVELGSLGVITTKLRALCLLKRASCGLHIRRARCRLGFCGACQEPQRTRTGTERERSPSIPKKHGAIMPSSRGGPHCICHEG